MSEVEGAGKALDATIDTETPTPEADLVAEAEARTEAFRRKVEKCSSDVDSAKALLDEAEDEAVAEVAQQKVTKAKEALRLAQEALEQYEYTLEEN